MRKPELATLRRPTIAPRRAADACVSDSRGPIRLRGHFLRVAVIGSVVLAGCAGPGPSGGTATAAPPLSAPGSGEATAGVAGSNGPITVEGTGADSSQPITLTAGTYVVTWSATPPSTTACQHKAALESTSEDYLHELMNERITRPVKDRQVVIKGVPAGIYYFDVNSECDWRFVLIRQP